MKVSGIVAMVRNRANRESLYSTAEYWDAKARTYSDKSASMWPNNHLNAYYHAEQIAVIENCLSDVRRLRILEVGCGTGRMSEYFASRGASVLGFDFAATAIDIARRHAHGGNPAYRVQSVFDLSDRAAFDVVVSWGVVTIACRTRADLLDAMKRLRAALVQGGKALFLEPVHRGFLHRVLNMSLREFRNVMSEAGFKVTDVTHLHFWPARLALCYFVWPKPITAVGYHAGQLIMKLSSNRAWGDYQAIYATA